MMIWVVVLAVWFALHIAWTAREVFFQDEPVQAVVTVSQSDARGSAVYFTDTRRLPQRLRRRGKQADQ